MLWFPSSKTGFFLARRLANGTKKMHPWQWQSSIVVKCESFHFRSLLLHQLLGKLLSLLCSRSGAIFLLARIAPSLLLWAWEVKGGLMSGSFFFLHWLKYQYEVAKLHSWALSLFVQSAQESDLAALFGDVSQSEKLSEIKPPLESTSLFLSIQYSEEL